MAANKTKLVCQFCGSEHNPGNFKRHLIKCEQEHRSVTPNGNETTQFTDVTPISDRARQAMLDGDDLDSDDVEEIEDGEDGFENLEPIKALASVEPQTNSLDVPTNPMGLRGTLTKTSWQPPENLTTEEWIAEGRKLEEITNATQWWWGDWIRFGERKYGEMYSQALDASGLQKQTLENAVWVASRFNPEQRHPKLKFGHHAEVATKKLEAPEAQRLLKVAADNNLSVKEFRAVVKTVLHPETQALPKAELQCQCHCHHATCLECHKPTGAHPA